MGISYPSLPSGFVCADVRSVEQKAQRRHWRRARVQAYSEEGDHVETSGPHLEVNGSCAVCECFVYCCVLNV